MLETIFSRRRGILLLTVLVAVTGSILLNNLPTKLYPSMRKPRVGVNLSHPAYTATDFFEGYSETIENALLGVRDMDSLEATYRNGSTRIRVEFDWDLEPDEARTRVETAMASIRTSLPDEARDYSVSAWRSDNPGILSVAVFSTELEPRELYSLIEPILRRPFGRVEDAEEITIVNVEELRAEVTLDHDAMLRYGLTAPEVSRAVQAGYRPVSLGSFRTDTTQHTVRIRHGIDTIFDISRIRVATVGQTPVYLSDLADVSVRYDLPRRIFRANGERSVMIYAVPTEGGNIRQMSREVRRILDEATVELPDHIRYSFMVDPADFIDTALGNVILAALIGATLAMTVIILLLGEWKNTFIIGLSLPLAMTMTFILMSVFEISLNLISLGGLTLSVGMIIDSSIVVMENIHRHRHERPDRTAGRETITTAVHEVRAAVVVSTLTSMVVFLPLSFTSPITAAVLGDLANTVIFALGSSLLVSLTVVPLTAFYLYRKPRRTPEDSVMARFSQRLLNRMIGLYRRLLNRLLAGRLVSGTFILGSFVVLFMLIGFVLPRIPTEIIGEPESDKVVLWFSHSSVQDQEELLDLIIPIENELLESYERDLEGLFTQIVSDSRGNFILSLGTSARRREVEEELRERYGSTTDWQFRVFPWDPAAMPLPMVRDLHLTIQGEDSLTVAWLLEEAAEILREEQIYANVFTNPSGRYTEEIVMTPRHEVIAAIPEHSLSNLVSLGRAVLAGSTGLEMTEGTETIRVRLMYPDGVVQSRESFENLLVPYDGRGIPLRHFFDLSQAPGLSTIVSEDGEARYSIYGRIGRRASGADRESREQQAIRLIEERVSFPPGYSLEVIDTQTEINASIRSLFIALGVSILAIFVILTLQFNSVRVPLVILVTVPLGFMGVIGSLYLFSSTLSLNSLLGTILLGGIVVNNAIIMIDFYFRSSMKFETRREALVYAAGLRFAPIVITMSTTILGMLPIALALGDGTNIIQPLGIAVSGGLLVSTLFTLFMVPCIMNLLPGLDTALTGRE